jgi:hypothetical protein
MEQDLAARHFTSGFSTSSTSTTSAQAEVGGIAEHLGAVGEDGTRSI